MRIPASTDSRLLLAGVAAFLALVAYLGVAFARTHSPASAPASALFVGTPAAPSIAPWVPHDSKFVRTPPRGGSKFAVRFRSAVTEGTYGALVPTLTSNPKSGRRYIVGLSLKGSRPGGIGVEVDEFAPGAKSIYVINTTVRAPRRWRHFTFSARVKGTWLGLGMYVYRIDRRRGNWFAVRDLAVTYR